MKKMPKILQCRFWQFVYKTWYAQVNAAAEPRRSKRQITAEINTSMLNPKGIGKMTPTARSDHALEVRDRIGRVSPGKHQATRRRVHHPTGGPALAARGMTTEAPSRIAIRVFADATGHLLATDIVTAL